ncbi:MAG: hypothetical protein FGM52_07715 [Mycobacterium sp.]|nr:hypothetical protein [Mycobacterium sp.]
MLAGQKRWQHPDATRHRDGALTPGQPAVITLLRGKKELALSLDIVQRQRVVAAAPGRRRE